MHARGIIAKCAQIDILTHADMQNSRRMHNAFRDVAEQHARSMMDKRAAMPTFPCEKVMHANQTTVRASVYSHKFIWCNVCS